MEQSSGWVKSKSKCKFHPRALHKQKIYSFNTCFVGFSFDILWKTRRLECKKWNHCRYENNVAGLDEKRKVRQVGREINSYVTVYSFMMRKILCVEHVNKSFVIYPFLRWLLLRSFSWRHLSSKLFFIAFINFSNLICGVLYRLEGWKRFDSMIYCKKIEGILR